MRRVGERSRWVIAALAAVAVVAGTPDSVAAATNSAVYLAGSGGDNYSSASDSNDCSNYYTPCATLDGALAQTSPGGAIIVSGSLTLSAAAVISQNVTIEQNSIPGSARALLSATAGNDSNGFLVVNGAYNVQVTGIAFDDGQSTGDYGAAITNNDGGTVTITGSTFNANHAWRGGGGAIDNGDYGGTGTLTVTDSTFSQSGASGNGGTIDNGDNGGTGTLTVTDSTFDQSFASGDGGAIDNGDNGGTGTATIDGSTFSSDYGSDGGAIDNGDNGGTGKLTVTASTFDIDDASANGGAIDNADNAGSGTLTAVSVTFAAGRSNLGANQGQAIANDAASNAPSATVNVAADLFGGSCDSPVASTWNDYGSNASTDSSCLGSPPSSRPDATPGSAAALLEPLANNGGSTATMELENGNPAIHLIPLLARRFTVPAPNAWGSVGEGCSYADDQRTGNGGMTTVGCDAGAVQLATQPVTYVSGLGSQPIDGESDANDCTSPQSPCATLAGALAQTTPGGTVEVSGSIAASAATTVKSDATIEQSTADGARRASLTGTPSDTSGLLDIGTNATVQIHGVDFSNATNSGAGGAIENLGTLTVDGSDFAGNTSDQAGGAIESGPSLTLTNDSFEHNSAVTGGGAVDAGAISVSDSTFDSNISGNGGGAIAGGPMIVSDSTFKDNVADGTFIGNPYYPTGGALLVGSSGSTVKDDTFSGNVAVDGGAIDAASKNLTIDSSTFSGNSAQEDGGAVMESASPLSIVSSTFAANSASGAPNDVGDNTLNDVFFSGTLNVAADVFADACDITGTVADYGYNVSASSTCLGTPPTGQRDAAVSAAAGDLGALADNGGPTQTIELDDGNPAIDLIPNPTSFTVPAGSSTVTIACPVITDQRGDANPGVKGCDAGATQYAQQAVAFSDSQPLQVGWSSAFGIGGLTGLRATFAVDRSTPGFGTAAQACTYDGSLFFHMVHVGSCVIDGTAPGNVNFQSATATKTLTIVQGTQTVSFSSSAPTDAVVGGAAYTPVAASSRGQAVDIAIDPATTNDACSYDAASGSVSFNHAGSCVVDAVQGGSADYAPAQAQQTFVVAQAATTTSLSISHSQISATVTATPPGGGSPTGAVSFTVDGKSVGTAQLVNGVAILKYSVPTDKSHQIAAAYAGDGDYASSSDSTARNDPSITAKETSADRRSASDWWRSPVRIRFTCHTDGSPLIVLCPGPVTLAKSGAAQSVTVSIAARNGGTATLTVSPINIDRTRPAVRIVGPHNHRIYRGTVPAARCKAKDRVSGVRSCKIARRARRTARGKRITYTATATSMSGVRARTRIIVKVRRRR